MPRFMFPPHPGKAQKMPVTELDNYEKQGGWLAQRKFNGSHTIAHLHKSVLTIWNRQFQPFTYYTLTPEMTACFSTLGIDPNTEVIFDGELLHTKAKYAHTGKQAVTDTIVLYDLLYFGEPLIHKAYGERNKLLAELCGNPTELEAGERGIKVSEVGKSNLWLAETFKDDFLYRWYEMYQFKDDEKKIDLYPEIEGLVLKREKDSFITIGARPYDVTWMMRVRKEKKKTYQF